MKTSIFRRRFIERVTLASAGALGIAQAGSHRAVEYHVKGFTCATCAVGLETLLRQQLGVLRAEADYPRGQVRIEYNCKQVTEPTLKAYITDMGFQVEPPYAG